MDVEYRYDWKLIACVDDHWGIGRQGQLLVDIPADKKAFKAAYDRKDCCWRQKNNGGTSGCTGVA